jgi:hypothetical protein
MPKSNVSLVLNSRDATNSTPLNPAYQSTQYNSRGQNIIQGQINTVEVSEVNFPYDIPNVQQGPPNARFGFAYNSFGILSQAVNNPTNTLNIIVPAGFYTGTELAQLINAIIVGYTPAFIALTDIPVLSYSDSQNKFTFTAPAAPVDPDAANWLLLSPFVYSPDAVPATLGKDLLSIMGFAPNIGFTLPGRFTTARPITSNSAPLTFTQYVDICSPQLCKFQFFRDGSTTNLARRNDVICRLFISNSIGIQEPEGTRPFVLERQFFNSRVMRWTADNSIGEIDIDLYDDCGQPLTITGQPRPFQITFNVYEHETKPF